MNGYGPTETTISCTMKVITDSKNITIGAPNGNVKVYVVDKENRILSDGETGELVVAGLGVGRGYMNLPEKTIDTEKEFDVTWHDNWESELQMHIEKLTNDAKKDLNRALIAGEIENFEISYQYHMLKEEVVCEVLAKGTTMFPFNLFGKNQLKYDVKSQGRAYDEIKLLWKMNLLKGDDSSD